MWIKSFRPILTIKSLTWTLVVLVSQPVPICIILFFLFSLGYFFIVPARVIGDPCLPRRPRLRTARQLWPLPRLPRPRQSRAMAQPQPKPLQLATLAVRNKIKTKKIKNSKNNNKCNLKKNTKNSPRQRWPCHIRRSASTLALFFKINRNDSIDKLLKGLLLIGKIKKLKIKLIQVQGL